MSRNGFTITQLVWRDRVLDEIAMPRGALRVTLGLGSGLTRRPRDQPGRLWALGDRGPNLKISQAVEDCGLDHLQGLAGVEGAKLMPRPDIGPTITELSLIGDELRFVRTLPLRAPSGRTISGLPLPGGGEAAMEPAYDLNGNLLAPDGGADTEGVVALADGGFWVADEYGPSLMRIDPHGVVTARWVPEGVTGDCDPPLSAILPAIGARRRLNRGFEALAISADETWLYVAFQSPLDHGDVRACSRHARIWKIDATSGAVAAQYVYPFDTPSSFARDRAAGEVQPRDLKISEAVCVGPDRLLVLERISQTSKLYLVDLAGPGAPPHHLDAETRPTLEELRPEEMAEAGIPFLTKVLLLSTDDTPEITADLEGVALMSDRELILVNDNDFGIEGVETRFYRVTFERPIAGEP
ncbi:esterase-like activity of phytase family protein [Phenylobacterium sp.]|uniref:esterase-like activity of phytase family protein n=1 Tax=Phenylobacterium sp. TaxID=1871053 RepID=UPI00273179C6|nr:esterase-like activity of phytase family protein [Phenylobacterium sp.]MDP1597544.1 esterase-like activity of phytase family protein [Phenylobacterium sp.]MDP3594169.1 esterase-like activity of phytase family protein [Phenylobacterium sp.]